MLQPRLRPLLHVAAENREHFPSSVPPPAALRGEVPKTSPLLQEVCRERGREPDPRPRHTETILVLREAWGMGGGPVPGCAVFALGVNLAEPEQAAACGLLGSKSETH